MRGNRALLVLVFVLIALVLILLFLLSRRHNTITTYVSSSGLVGGSAQAGDTLVFRTYQAGDPGYTVQFSNNWPCADLKVTTNQEGSCQIPSYEGQRSFFYTVIRNVSSRADEADKRSTTTSGGPHPYTAIPCRLCYLELGSVAGDARGNQLATPNPPSDNVTADISCSVANSGNPGVIPDPAVVIEDSVATIGWVTDDTDWTVTFNNGSPCINSTTQFSSGGASQCSISPGAAIQSYSYKWTLSSCSGKSANGSGTVTLVAPKPAQ
jgi:hypothetical protein